MIKGYRYRLYPTKDQQIQLAKTFGSCRFVYNQILAKKMDLYKSESKSLTKTECNNYCNRTLKGEYIWLKEVDKFALTNAIYALDNAYQNFFSRVKQGSSEVGFPKFKSKKNRHYSYNEYFMMLKFENDTTEFYKLINDLTVNETYFFRDFPQLRNFAEDVLL